MESQIETITGPTWKGVRYFSTTLAGGVSQQEWAGLNLGQHCGDNATHVQQNRQLLNALLPSPPHWLQQVHGTQLYHALQPAHKTALLPYEQAPVADAAWLSVPNTVIAVLTADCLPVVIADSEGRVVGVAHAGWRGLAAGVLEKLFFQLQSQVGETAYWQAWIGPAISQKYFEVGQEVFDIFIAKDSQLAAYFIPIIKSNKYLADLAGLAANRLSVVAENKLSISFSGACTYGEKNTYYSYRRRPTTGRMVTLAWLDQNT